MECKESAYRRFANLPSTAVLVDELFSSASSPKKTQISLFVQFDVLEFDLLVDKHTHLCMQEAILQQFSSSQSTEPFILYVARLIFSPQWD
ncbi:hypothetical protein T07_4839 [Trichinella nelsoni]|uniref:Uncharacterized protein n=1 Tax=Trichinella nelsoni TaxID=6336 RepID=A0A0V0SC51_9BILA|nr:hypothetical protein T07_4839 [Trichinella nelsoni]